MATAKTVTFPNPPQEPALCDLQFADHGSIWIMTPQTDAGRDWIAVYIPEDAQSWAGGIVIEPRYVEDVMQGALADGLTVEG